MWLPVRTAHRLALVNTASVTPVLEFSSAAAIIFVLPKEMILQNRAIAERLHKNRVMIEHTFGSVADLHVFTFDT